jgi:hypothetical protein
VKNRPTAQGCVYSSYYGHVVERCCFSGTTNQNDIVTFDPNAVTRKFEVNDCIFSGGLPDSKYCRLSGCRSNVNNLATHVIWHIDFDDCPGVPTPKPETDVPDATPPRTANSGVTNAPVPSATLALPNCQNKLEDRTRRIFLTEGCLDLSDSTFLALKPPDGTVSAGTTDSLYQEKGGAVSANSKATSAKITNCLFWKCYVILGTNQELDPGYGGAIYLSPPRVDISRCCGQECYGRQGHFLYLDRKSGEASPQRDLSLTTLHLCAPGTRNGGDNVASIDGGVFCVDKVGLLASYMNVSMGKM